MALLEISGIDVFYGRVQAVRGASLTVDKGEVVALIGSHGAGKTTTLRTTSGLLRPCAGTITFSAHGITPTTPHTIVEPGPRGCAPRLGAGDRGHRQDGHRQRAARIRGRTESLLGDVGQAGFGTGQPSPGIFRTTTGSRKSSTTSRHSPLGTSNGAERESPGS